jgi:hypothetical protein
MSRFPPALLAAVLAAAVWPSRAHALLGLGDVVYDPANTAQTINLLRQAQQEFDRIGSLLGVSTRQLDQLLALATALGNPAEAAQFARPLTAAQLQDLVRSLPGLAGADLSALLNPQGMIDPFLGVPPPAWAVGAGRADAEVAAITSAPGTERAGVATSANPAAGYAAWYASLQPEDQANQGRRAAVDLSNLSAGAWLQGGPQRRTNLQALAAADQQAGATAGQARTASDEQHAQAQLAASTNSILLETAVQGIESSEAGVHALQAGNAVRQEQAEDRRNADVLRIDSPP